LVLLDAMLKAGPGLRVAELYAPGPGVLSMWADDRIPKLNAGADFIVDLPSPAESVVILEPLCAPAFPPPLECVVGEMLYAPGPGLCVLGAAAHRPAMEYDGADARVNDDCSTL
jgi:hypothetical protein